MQASAKGDNSGPMITGETIYNVIARVLGHLINFMREVLFVSV